jgi:lipoyl(octanoyl) transferase
LNLISVVQLGTIDYSTGLRLQQQLVALRKENKIGDVLLLLEHKPVITLGRNAKAANVVASPEFLKQRGVELFECDRGGDVTFHGPGQIVGYPVFDLRGSTTLSSPADLTILSSRAEENDSLADRSLKSRDLGFSFRKHLGAVDFVRHLEEVLMRTCADFAIPTKRVPGLTGVWTDPKGLSFRAEGDDSLANRSLESRNLLFVKNASSTPPEAKLAAIGVHISRFVTSHGFALNVNTDLSYFNLIIPCGITSKPVTSIQHELGRPLDLNAVAESISRNFGVVFQTQIFWVETLEVLLGSTLPVCR